MARESTWTAAEDASLTHMRRELKMLFREIAKKLGRSTGNCVFRYQQLYPHEKKVRIKKSGTAPRIRRSPSLAPNWSKPRKPSLHERLGIRTMTVRVPFNDRAGRTYMDVTLPAT